MGKSMKGAHLGTGLKQRSRDKDEEDPTLCKAREKSSIDGSETLHGTTQPSVTKERKSNALILAENKAVVRGCGYRLLRK